jgi:hypothetical protein
VTITPTPGAFFEVTGSMGELFRIMEGIIGNDGRLTSDSSATLDLWQEMLEEWFARHDQGVRIQGHRAGYETARQDMVSGAFVGGPTYEALKNSFTGQWIVRDAKTELLRELADGSGPFDRPDRAYLRAKAAQTASNQ